MVFVRGGVFFFSLLKLNIYHGLNAKCLARGLRSFNSTLKRGFATVEKQAACLEYYAKAVHTACKFAHSLRTLYVRLPPNVPTCFCPPPPPPYNPQQMVVRSWLPGNGEFSAPSLRWTLISRLLV